VPPLQPVPQNHVLSRSFYLIKDYPGRYAGRRLWIEQAGDAAAPRGDSVSRLFIGDADWASAWAVDQNGRDLYSVDGGAEQRETARRFGVNLVMYVLTGSYKDDQVHVPALLERLGEGEGEANDPRLPVPDPDGGRDERSRPPRIRTLPRLAPVLGPRRADRARLDRLYCAAWPRLADARAGPGAAVRPRC
jgi:hypothetical protein